MTAISIKVVVVDDVAAASFDQHSLMSNDNEKRIANEIIEQFGPMLSLITGAEMKVHDMNEPATRAELDAVCSNLAAKQTLQYKRN